MNIDGSEIDFPSIDDVEPIEEGGPAARSGFTYQDEIAVSFLIEMLEHENLIKIHCETHDDIVLVRAEADATSPHAEYVQVKSKASNSLWSIADLCRRTDDKVGKSVLETSLVRDRCRESSRFRIVTLRDVVKDLKILTYPRNNSARDPKKDRFSQFCKNLVGRLPDVKSEKGNTIEFWVKHCLWECSESLKAVRNSNFIRMLKLSNKENRNLLPDQVDLLLDDLRTWAREAGDAKWTPDRQMKIITNPQMREWWDRHSLELIANKSKKSGGNLAKKMGEAGLPDELVNLAIDLRLNYSASVRTKKYMQPEEASRLQERVKSEMISLRSSHVAGELDLDGVGFHSRCLSRLDEVNGERMPETEDSSAYLKGCMYDITDRCLHRFTEREK